MEPVGKSRECSLWVFSWVLVTAAFMVAVSLSLSSAASTPKSSKASKEVESILTGRRTWKEWQSQTDWDDYSGERYQPSREKIKKIGRLAKSRNARFLVFAGSWCKDSEAGVPSLMKLLNKAGIASDRVDLYGVDGQMDEPSGTARLHNIGTVPTVVILSGGDELGRVVERPQSSWQDDMIGILSGN